jgi:hypothetical protein
MFFGIFFGIFFGDSSAVASPGAEWGRAMFQANGRFSYAALPASDTPGNPPKSQGHKRYL